ncbi:hypothetical protein [Halococcus thailandensis]|uniref:Uncharacterized protein n=1 Tax=Halococcus thailandensis JCM 13552 TaxID=1227457 RepID=M0NF36_9EURY|nr:hypothetical protein [Halococcus thailandensis]EMA56456.1 hypothetical protein C451_01988 [Halococcus thailandensis JCM 13552]
MGSSNGRPYLSPDGQPLIRQYLIRAAKAYLCVGCWFGVCALLLLYGPAALSVPTDPARATGVMAAVSGVVLSAGVATVLTIVLAVGTVAVIDRRRRNQSANEQEQSAPDAPDSMEDETHA